MIFFFKVNMKSQSIPFTSSVHITSLMVNNSSVLIEKTCLCIICFPVGMAFLQLTSIWWLGQDILKSKAIGDEGVTSPLYFSHSLLSFSLKYITILKLAAISSSCRLSKIFDISMTVRIVSIKTYNDAYQLTWQVFWIQALLCASSHLKWFTSALAYVQRQQFNSPEVVLTIWSDNTFIKKYSYLRCQNKCLHELPHGLHVIGQLAQHLHHHSLVQSGMSIHMPDLSVTITEAQSHHLLMDFLFRKKKLHLATAPNKKQQNSQHLY